MNALGKEYGQLGGNYAVMHHTEYLDLLVQQGKLSVPLGERQTLAFHDPCYLGRHNGVYDAPRNLLRVLSNDVRELGRTREKSFCCGAGGAQFWKEEEPGSEKISENRLREAEQVLAEGSGEKTLAVGCPFCKSMLQSSSRGDEKTSVAVADVAELLWARIAGETAGRSSSIPLPRVPAVETSAHLPAAVAATAEVQAEVVEVTKAVTEPAIESAAVGPAPVTKRAKWAPRKEPGMPAVTNVPVTDEAEPRQSADVVPGNSSGIDAALAAEPAPAVAPTERKKWPGKKTAG